jgi:nucleoside-diphosphate-sugar epimerase
VPAGLFLTLALASEAVGALRHKPPLLDRGRLDTMCRSVSYSIAAFQKATSYVPPFSLEEAAGRIADWFQASGR